MTGKYYTLTSESLDDIVHDINVITRHGECLAAMRGLVHVNGKYQAVVIVPMGTISYDAGQRCRSTISS